MTYHMFDTELAEELGVNAAIVFHAVSSLCEHNRANGRHIHDGLAWTYDSVAAMHERHPYLSKGAIRKALKDLEEAGYIVSGNYNPTPYDRTKWYADTGAWSERFKNFDFPKKANENSESFNSNICTNKVPNRVQIEREGAREKRKLGTYTNVSLTDGELAKLQAEFPDWQERVDRLSEYMASTGKRYRSHLATIRAWARRDREKAGPKGAPLYGEERAGEMEAFVEGMWGPDGR